MPKKLLKKFMPDERQLKENPCLRWLGHHIHDVNLWQLNRHSVSKAFLVGIFCAFLPIPAQMVVAACFSLLIRSNLPISVGLVWLTNPLTMPPIFYVTWLIGDAIIGDPNQHIDFQMSMSWLAESISIIWWPLLFGSILCGIVLGSLSYVIVQRLWVWQVNRTWRLRRQKPNKDSKAKPIESKKEEEPKESISQKD